MVNNTPKYQLSPQGKFIIKNYNFSKPFASFFPGIAGKYGIPMWVFYVNRGQAIASFGTKDKDHAILEFFPANRSWQLTSLQGFRTFIKISNTKKTIFYEPFCNGLVNSKFNLSNCMQISSYDLKLQENNLTLGLTVNVEYFTIPNDSYAGLVRIVTIKNTDRARKKIQLLDGLPQIVPYGTANLFLKKLSRTVEAWMKVKNLEKDVPFYKLDVDPTDRPEVVHITEGNFYLGFHFEKEKPRIIKPIIDPQCIFDLTTDFCIPFKFLKTKSFRYPKNQVNQCKTPCGFLFLDLELTADQEKSFYSVIGFMRSQELLNASLQEITRPDYLIKKQQENKEIILGLQRDIETKSNSFQFDLYAKQTYLDNIMRGGYPIVFPQASGHPMVFYLYSRKHGDLERDYNKFQLQPTYFSQGNGNYRDINQNHRCDIWFNPDIKDEALINLFNLIQPDGFNPLVVKGLTFTLKNPQEFKTVLEDLVVDKKKVSEIITFLGKTFFSASLSDQGHTKIEKLSGFTPGEVILFLEENKIKLNVSYDIFLNTLLSNCKGYQEAEHGDGFWTDHWTYNLDLLEAYLGVYPENLKEILFDKKIFTFFDNSEIVRPRHEKYILKDGYVRQIHALMSDNAKREMIKKRTSFPHVVRTDYGKGEIYQTSLVNKLLCLVVNKLASLDPFGVGIEMEANKPNWYDALNGLPALFGSSVCETFELKRLILFIKSALKNTRIQKISVTEEIHEFLINLNSVIQAYLKDKSSNRDYQCWDKSYSLKEDYRQKTKFGFSGREIEILTADLISILNNALERIGLGIDRAFDKQKNVYYAYFINEVVEYKSLNPPFVQPTKFIQKKLPLFLESQMHALRLSNDIKQAKAIHEGTRKSDLFDTKLKMYKITASLEEMPEEIGRCRVFTRGWLEHESIWLHMEYKYILELLRTGLYKEFYTDFKNVLIPFQRPERYGRSILENSSFLVSSAFPDKKLHGNGFVGRLSGSTAEFLQIWLIMNLGLKPFFLNEKNELNLKFSPILPGWLFTRKDKTYSFNFLSKIWVVYHNPKRKDTFGNNAVKPLRIIFKDKDGKLVELLSDTIPSPYAKQIRSRQVKQIDVYLG